METIQKMELVFFTKTNSPGIKSIQQSTTIKTLSADFKAEQMLCDFINPVHCINTHFIGLTALLKYLNTTKTSSL